MSIVAGIFIFVLGFLTRHFHVKSSELIKELNKQKDMLENRNSEVYRLQKCCAAYSDKVHELRERIHDDPEKLKILEELFKLRYENENLRKDVRLIVSNPRALELLKVGLGQDYPSTIVEESK